MRLETIFPHFLRNGQLHYYILPTYSTRYFHRRRLLFSTSYYVVALTKTCQKPLRLPLLPGLAFSRSPGGRRQLCGWIVDTKKGGLASYVAALGVGHYSGGNGFRPTGPDFGCWWCYTNAIQSTRMAPAKKPVRTGHHCLVMWWADGVLQCSTTHLSAWSHSLSLSPSPLHNGLACLVAGSTSTTSIPFPLSQHETTTATRRGWNKAASFTFGLYSVAAAASMPLCSLRTPTL